MDRHRFGRSVRALRVRRAWRQQDLASAAGISRSVAGRVERGELGGARWRDLEALALALDGQLGLEFRWRGADSIACSTRTTRRSSRLWFVCIAQLDGR